MVPEKLNSDLLVFFVNGIKVEDPCVDPEWTLLRYLREKLRLPGTKLGCSEGGCGACTVMVSKQDSMHKTPRHYTVNACLSPVVLMHGLAVTTVEGIGSTRTRLHPVQERLAKSHGSQCGFCTPGIVMSMYTLLRNSPNPTMEEIEESLGGNLCRCTGYRPILEGFRTFSVESQEMLNGCGKNNCCMMKKQLENGSAKDSDTNSNGLTCTKLLYDPSSFSRYDPTQEIIFPPELMLRPELRTTSVVFNGPRVTHYRPTSLNELLNLKNQYPEAKIVAGNTEIGVEVKYKNQNYPVTISPAEVIELNRVEVHQNGVHVGSSVSLTHIEREFKKIIKEQKENKTRSLTAINEMLRWFAGRQIRNVACFGGNIITGSPISDLNPIFLAVGAKLKLRSAESEREIVVDENFFTSYRKNLVSPNEVLISIEIPFTEENQYVYAYKQSRRKDDDIAIVNAAFSVQFSNESPTIVKDILMAFGGMAPTPIMALNTMQKCRGKTWNSSLVQDTIALLLEELQLHPSAPGGMVEYRRVLAASFFFKFYLNVQKCLNDKYPGITHPLTQDEVEITKEFRYQSISSSQLYQEVSEDSEKFIDPIGQPKPHLAAQQQCTGEAIYIDDMPKFDNELYAALVTSKKAKAKILKIDESDALRMNGVKGFFSAKDLPGDRNITGVVEIDEEIFASNEVTFVGQVIGIVVADDPDVAGRAARKVKIQYQDMKPIITIQEAIDAKKFWGPWSIRLGDPEKVFESSECEVIESESYIGGQEHFYLETNAHIAVPHEGQEMEIFSSTQNPFDSQKYIAKALGVPLNRVVVRVKRMGGGFGGKQNRTTMVSIPLALAAYSLRRPIRIMLDRHEDMSITGTRHPFLNRWKAAFTKSGRILALEASLYSNAGATLDLSSAVMQRAVLSIDNAYKIENVSVSGFCCKTNLPPNTAYRGFGGPQGMSLIEDVLSKISERLHLNPTKLRENMFYREGDTTHYGQKLENVTLKRCWQQVLQSSNYEKRLENVKKFNRANRFKRRGISAIPTKYGVGFAEMFLNQGAALVQVYTDGSVLISHAGTEMGQGLHTKMVQVASKALNLSMDRIYIMETSTDKVPNSTPTAGSVSSDINGMAVLNACNKILARLEPFRKKAPGSSWDEWVNTAYFDRVSLSATGFYSTPDLEQYEFDNTPCKTFVYHSYGAAVSEVEIDCLTGDHIILRTDIVMDVGSSLNPAIDIGQIEGGFMQGVGLMTTEELRYTPDGELLTKGPGAYKIPSFQSIPRQFNVSLLNDAPNPRAVYSSKAIGEPPLFLASSVFNAIRLAVRSTLNKKDEGEGTRSHFCFKSPATSERIRMGCQDVITQQITPAEEGTFRPWSITV